MNREMKKTGLMRLLPGVLSVLVVLACGLMPSGQAVPAANPTEPAAPAEPAVQAGCSNPYFPAVPNAVRVYKSSGLSSGEYTQTDTVSEVRADGFTIQSDYGSGVKQVEWSCTPEGLRVYNTGADKSQGLSVSSGQFQFNVTFKNPSGVTLPPTIAPGDRWTQSFEYETSGGITGSGKAAITYEALGIESVTIPAGTFQAMKIQSQTKEDVNGTFSGVTVNSSNEYQTIYWFAEGVGLVKAETTGSYTETIELQSYNIP